MSLFIQGQNKKGEELFFFVRENGSEKIIYALELKEISRGGDIKMSNPRPKVDENLLFAEKIKEIEKLSPRMVVENGEKLIDVDKFVPYYPTPLLHCRY